jgi:hypothetical protein
MLPVLEESSSGPDQFQLAQFSRALDCRADFETNPPWNLLYCPRSEKAIDELLSAWSRNPKPFNWNATVDAIQEKLSRCSQILEQMCLASL